MGTMKKLLAVAVSAALLLSCLAGCGSKKSSLDFTDAFTGLSGMAPDTVVMTVDGVDVTAVEYYYQAYQVIYSFYSSYPSLFSDTDYSWISDTLGDYLPDYVDSNAAVNALLVIKADELGVTLSEEDEAGIDDTLQAFLDQSGSQEQFEEDLLKNYGLDPDSCRAYLEKQALYTALQDYYYGENGQTPVTGEEVQAYLDSAGIYRTKYILLYNDSYTDEEATALAADLIAQLQSAGDPDALMDELISEYSYDTGSVGEGTDFSAGQCVAEFETAALALPEGAISAEPVYSPDFGYFIIQRLPIPTEDYTDTTMSTLFQNLISEWIGQADIQHTEAYDAIDYQSYMENLAILNAQDGDGGDSSSAAG